MPLALVGLDKDLLDALADRVVAIFDPGISGAVWGIPVIGSDESWPDYSAAHSDVAPLLAIDPPRLRRLLADTYGHENIASWISPDAFVSGRATLGRGVIVQRAAFVSADVSLADGVRMNVGAQIHHGCVIGSFTTIAPGARLLGSVTIGDDVYVGAGAIVLQGLTIGDGATIGAGAVVTRCVPENETVVGIPAHTTSARPD